MDVLQKSGDDIDDTIKMLHELSLGHAAATEVNAGATPTAGEEAPPANGAEWVQLIVREMETATSIEEARFRAARVLESFQKYINTMLSEQLEVVLRENAILKRAVAIQHERHKEYEDRVQEVQQLKQLLTQYEEQLRTSDVNNYALRIRLLQSQQSNSIPGRCNRDVF